MPTFENISPLYISTQILVCWSVTQSRILLFSGETTEVTHSKKTLLYLEVRKTSIDYLNYIQRMTIL